MFIVSDRPAPTMRSAHETPRSRPRSLTTGFREGPTAKRMPVERKMMRGKAVAIHQPQKIRDGADPS